MNNIGEDATCVIKYIDCDDEDYNDKYYLDKNL